MCHSTNYTNTFIKPKPPRENHFSKNISQGEGEIVSVVNDGVLTAYSSSPQPPPNLSSWTWEWPCPLGMTSRPSSSKIVTKSYSNIFFDNSIHHRSSLKHHPSSYWPHLKWLSRCNVLWKALLTAPSFPPQHHIMIMGLSTVVEVLVLPLPSSLSWSTILHFYSSSPSSSLLPSPVRFKQTTITPHRDEPSSSSG